jgi:anti-sigma-K factor RskA
MIEVVMGTEHITELLPDYVLGCIDEEDTARVYQHLRACADCQAELQAYEAVVGQLALAARNAAPPPALKDRLMTCIQERQVVPAGASRTWWQALLDSLPRLRGNALAWQAAAIVLVVGLAAGNVWQWQRSDRPAPSHMGRFPSITMVNTPAAPEALGTLVMSADGQYGTLIVDGLPALDAGHQYQLWLIEAGQRTSGAVFSVNGDGYGSLAVSSPRPLSSYSSFGITIEPTGGSPGPSGEKVLSATM